MVYIWVFWRHEINEKPFVSYALTCLKILQIVRKIRGSISSKTVFKFDITRGRLIVGTFLIVWKRQATWNVKNKCSIIENSTLQYYTLPFFLESNLLFSQASIIDSSPKRRAFIMKILSPSRRSQAQHRTRSLLYSCISRFPATDAFVNYHGLLPLKSFFTMSSDLQWLLLRVCRFVECYKGPEGWQIFRDFSEEQLLHCEASPWGPYLLKGASG